MHNFVSLQGGIVNLKNMGYELGERNGTIIVFPPNRGVDYPTVPGTTMIDLPIAHLYEDSGGASLEPVNGQYPIIETAQEALIDDIQKAIFLQDKFL